jgi:hypothetical protein
MPTIHNWEEWDEVEDELSLEKKRAQINHSHRAENNKNKKGYKNESKKSDSKLPNSNS